MKRVGDYMKALGFNEESSDEAKKAFIQYLLREAQSYEKVLPLHSTQKIPIEDKSKPEVDSSQGEQLDLFSFTGS